jgi:hypothetical protein
MLFIHCPLQEDLFLELDLLPTLVHLSNEGVHIKVVAKNQHHESRNQYAAWIYPFRQVFLQI